MVVLHGGALNVIRQLDGPETLFYLAPPYLSDTRAAGNVYAHEMPADQHAELLSVIRGCSGKVMLSGYPSAVYDRELRGWSRYEFELPNQAAGGKRKRKMTEVLWCNS